MRMLIHEFIPSIRLRTSLIIIRAGYYSMLVAFRVVRVRDAVRPSALKQIEIENYSSVATVSSMGIL